MKKSTLIKLGVSIIILVLTIMFFDIDINNAINSVEKPKFIGFALIIPIIINPLISNNRWKFFLKVQGVSENTLNLVKYSFVALFMGLVLPATTGSDTLRIVFLEKKHKNFKGKGGASVIIERLIGFLLLALLGFIGSIIMYLQTGFVQLIYLTTVVVLCILFIFIIFKSAWLFRKLTLKLSKVKKWQRSVDYLQSLYEALNKFPIKNSLKYTIPLILAFQFSTIFCGYLVFLAFGIDLPFYYHLAFFPLIQIISIIPVSISGLGIREGSFVYFYGLLGINESIAFFVSIMYYILLMLVPAFIGMLIFLFDSKSFK
ncbi:MAG: lysylphosphatidylglycerol synthase transmembrane domain-containing protein [Bacteroidales bacterium]|nr:lysylphosphatidylglycerol synthase transmembrane domain-containing protein [Bacteroidales bacterium]